MLIQQIGILGTVLVTIAVVPALAKACTCIESYAPWIAEFSEADAVFVGKVHSVIPIARKSEDSFLGDRIVTFEVGKKYKGVGSSTRLISLYADYNSSSCSFGVDSRKGPRKGEMWLVLAHKGDSPQMSFGGSCNASTKVDSKSIKIIEAEAFKFPQKQGILGSVVRNYMSLAKNVEVSLRGEGIDSTLTVDADGYF